MEIIKGLSNKADKAQEDWIAPTLINSWAISSGITVGYRKDDFGRVYLKGGLGGGTSGTTAFVLPVGYRPAQTRYYNGYTGSTSTGKLAIDASGNLQISQFSTLIFLDMICFDTL